MLVAPDKCTQLFSLRIHGLVVFLNFHSQHDCAESVLHVHRDLAAVSCIHSASLRPAELQLTTCLCKSDTAKKIFCSDVTAPIIRLVNPYSKHHSMYLMPS